MKTKLAPTIKSVRLDKMLTAQYLGRTARTRHFDKRTRPRPIIQLPVTTVKAMEPTPRRIFKTTCKIELMMFRLFLINT